MALSFPTNPQLNDTYTSGSTTWQWNGESWVIKVIPPTDVNYETVNTADLVVTGDSVLNNVSITGTVTGISAIGGASSLNDLTDVSIPTPIDQYILQYDQSLGYWVAAPSPVGSDGSFNGGTISNPLFINNTTGATNFNSGALRVLGGASIAENLYVAGKLVIEDDHIELRARSSLRLYNSNNNNYVAIQGPDSSTDVTYVLPGADGSAGQFLRTNGSGVLSWATATGGEGGLTSPGGVSGNIQFNDSGLFEGDTNLTYNAVAQRLNTVNITATGNIVFSGTTESTNSSTGTLTTGGGAGIAGNINVAGSQNTFTGNTESTSINTGTIVVTGGMGISGKVHVGDTISTSTPPTNTDHLTNKKYVDANVLAFSVAFGA
jgi:hypothetical protein